MWSEFFLSASLVVFRFISWCAYPTVLHPVILMLWMALPYFIWYLWGENSCIWITPRFSFSRTRAFPGLLWAYDGHRHGLSLSWFYGPRGDIFIHFLNTVCFFLVAFWLMFESCPRPLPAILPQMTVLHCTLISRGSQVLNTYCFH